jgi:ribulose 1,5-bisphosphate synthetase/thiazole synthase
MFVFHGICMHAATGTCLFGGGNHHQGKHLFEQVCIADMTQTNINECPVMYADNPAAVVVCRTRPFNRTMCARTMDLEQCW